MTTQIAKIHKTLFSLLIFFLPVQLGKHFWPDWTMVYGLRLDYLSPTLYLTDIIVIGILVSWAIEKFTNPVILRRSRRISWLVQARIRGRFFTSFRMTIKVFRMTRRGFFLFSFFFFLLFNCFFSQNQPAAFYKFFKLVEFFLLGFYIAKNSLKIENFKFQIFVAVIYSSLLAIAQFINQRSLGGIFYWLGERNFTAGTPGIAQTIWDGRLLLRSYASFPHPNVLAGFLVISLLLMTQFSIFNSQKSFAYFQFSRNFQLKNFSKQTLPLMAFILGVIALFLTFSHVAWVVFGIALLIKTFVCHSRESGNPGLSRETWIPDQVGDDRKPRSHKKKILFALVFLLFTFYFLLSAFPIQSESITYRQDLNLAAIKMWKSSPLFGVGLNNFLVRLPEFYQSSGEIRWFQPAHNIFLMVLVETGLIGLICLIWFLVLTYKRLLDCSIVKLLIPLTAILVLGLFDHYFYTLQQGQLLVALVFGLAWSNSLQNGKISG